MLKHLQARPFVKWAGGKQALAHELSSRFPSSYETYFEPFLGGGSIFFSVAPDKAVLGDSNDWLISTYKAVQEDYRAVAAVLGTLTNTRSEFLRIRSRDRAELTQTERAAHFIYLNKTCFRGLYRVNRQGQFNVPYGDYNRRYFDLEELRIASEVLRGIELRSGDFETSIAEVSPQDFVYFDPPYYKFGGYSDFNRYTPNQFRESDHIRLAALCRELHARGVRWAVSNSDTHLVRSLYAGFKMERIKARREINLTAKNRDILELLITNF
jgi:DNA adenine methylase